MTLGRVSIGNSFLQFGLSGKQLLLVASRKQTGIVGLCCFQAGLGDGNLAPGTAVIEHNQQLSSFDLSALLHQNFLNSSRQWSVSFKAMNGFDFSVGNDGVGDVLTVWFYHG